MASGQSLVASRSKEERASFFRPAFALSHAKSNYSRTSAAFARKSNYSRTYAKHRGWGCLSQNVFAYNPFVFSRHVNYVLNYMNTYIVGAPTFSFFHAAEGKPNERRPLRKAVATNEGGTQEPI